MGTAFYRIVMAVAALLLAVATALGAWASHGLESVLDDSAAHAFETAVTYQLVHALGLFGIGIYGAGRRRTRWLGLGAVVLLGGIGLFCGGVYASSLGGPQWLSSVAPAGGVGLIVGWISIGAAVLLEPFGRHEQSGL